MAANTAGIQVGGGSPGGGGGSVTAVTGSNGIASSGGATPNISLAPIAAGHLLYNAGPGSAPPISTSLATVLGLAPVQLTGHVSGSGNLGTNVNTTLATVFTNATFGYPVSLTTDQYGRVIGCGSANAPQSVAVLAKLGDPFAPSGSWSPGEYLGTTTIFSTPDPTLAGGFLEADGESIIDLFSVMVQQAVPSTAYNIEVWELDEFNNPSQCISNTTSNPIIITVPAGRNFAQNTVDTFTLLSGHRLLIRLEPGFGFSPGQVDCSARRVKA